LLNVAGLRERLWRARGPSRIESLAILPLENLSGNPEQDYFAEGMTDELITNLAQIKALRVISRTSAMRYKGTKKSLQQIAQELNVDAMVEGSVLRSDGRVRITAQLIQAATDRHLWAQSYERDVKDVLALQADVARAIAAEIAGELNPREQTGLASTRPVIPDAYEAYLKGRYFWNKRTPDGFHKALGFYQQAIEIDPGYARAYSGLADTYTLMQNYGLLSPEDASPKARAAALKALELDETLAEAHTSLGAVREDFDKDWSGAEREYKRAIEANPNYETAHQWYATLLSTLGRHEEALAQAKRARELAPVSPRVILDVGWVYYWMRLYGEALDEARKTLELEPNFAPAHTLLGWACLRRNLNEQATVEFQKALDLSGDSMQDRAAMAYAYAISGQRAAALQALEELKKRSQHSSALSYQAAVVYAGLGKKEQALESLKEAYEGPHDKWIGLLKVEPSFDPLRSDPRFRRLLRRLNLPE
jgi:TolB-like protein/Tfp pilus assembly protein PilF